MFNLLLHAVRHAHEIAYGLGWHDNTSSGLATMYLSLCFYMCGSLCDAFHSIVYVFVFLWVDGMFCFRFHCTSFLMISMAFFFFWLHGEIGRFCKCRDTFYKQHHYSSVHFELNHANMVHPSVGLCVYVSVFTLSTDGCMYVCTFVKTFG